MEHEKQDTARRRRRLCNSRRDTRRLGGHGQPTCTHTHPETTQTHNRASKHHGGGGGSCHGGARSWVRNTTAGVGAGAGGGAAMEEHTVRSRPRETNPVVGRGPATGDQRWERQVVARGTGFLCRCEKVPESGGDGHTPSRTDIAKARSVTV